MEIKQVILVRKDLNMPVGKLAVQVSHACERAFFSNYLLNEEGNIVLPSNEERLIYLQGASAKILLAVYSEEELVSLINSAKSSGLTASLIKDLGRTIFKEPTITCGAIGPNRKDLIDNITRHLKLYN